MPKRVIFFVIAIAAVFVALFFFKDSKPKEPAIGAQHPVQSRDHIARGQNHASYNSELPSSGPHYSDADAPTQWGIYTHSIPPEVYVHNEEHGGVVVAYNTDLLPADQLKKLRALFVPPYSNKDFQPLKFIVMPRPENKSPIEMAAWTWTLSLNNYDEATIIKFFNQHAGDAPEPTSGPFNEPINQAAQ